MKLRLKSASLATMEQLFRYKEQGFTLRDFPFPGYTDDQWGVKAHNRPWIEEAGRFGAGQRIIEVGGAYSLLPKYLAQKYQLEGWIGDDFGGYTQETSMWARWGNPRELPAKHPELTYVFEPFGKYSPNYPDQHFDRIFSVSTLEHIPREVRLDVFKDMNRCLKPGGRQIHSIDITTTSLKKILFYSATDYLPKFLCRLHSKAMSEIRHWIDIVRQSGIHIDCSVPKSIQLLDRMLLVESPDVIYRFYPPNDQSKEYRPNASLLLVIEKDA
jgi:SAM-dependent methyltransferase